VSRERTRAESRLREPETRFLPIRALTNVFFRLSATLAWFFSFFKKKKNSPPLFSKRTRDDAYSLDDLVGGRSGRFSAAGKSYTRRDFALINRRRQRVVCSLFEGRAGAGAGAGVAGAASASAAAAPFLSSSLPAASSSPVSPAPVVIYAHCNSGSRRDAEEVMGLLLPAGIAVAALDFSGSGLSDGAHVSLGAFEAEDLADLIALLAAERGPGCRIAIWGRSMGAVAALLAAAAEAREAAAAAAGSSPSSSTPPARPPPKTNIAAVVLDSPFSSLPELMAELVAKQRLLPLPRALLSPNGFLLRMMARSVEKRAGFDLRGVVPVRAVSGAGSGCPSSSSRSSSSSSSSVGRSKSKATAASGADGAPASSAASSPDEERRRLFASLLPPALFGHAEADSFIAPRHSRALHGRYLGSDKALCAFGGDHNSARPASFRSAALGFLKEALFPAAAGGAGEGGGGGGGAGERRRAVTTAAAQARHDGGGGDERARLPSLASLGAATAFDAALSAAAPDHRGFGAVAAGHAADERESWGRAASLAASASAAAGPGLSSPPWHACGGGNGSAEEEDEELLEMERAIAASLELTCAEAEREAREAKEAALAAAAAAAAATEQLRRETQQREREHQAAAAVTRGSCFAPPASSLLETATTAAAASFDLTPDQRELHAFFSPPSPTAAAAAEKRIRQGQQRERAWEREQQRKPAAIAASKRPLALPKAPPVFPSSSSSAPSRKNVEARAGGWKS